jgi:hypothetical protein
MNISMKKMLISAALIMFITAIADAQTTRENKSLEAAPVEPTKYVPSAEVKAASGEVNQEAKKEIPKAESTMLALEEQAAIQEGKSKPVSGLTEKQNQQLAELEKSMAEKRKAISENPDISKEQKDKLLQQAEIRKEAAIKEILGDAGYETYKKSLKH